MAKLIQTATCVAEVLSERQGKVGKTPVTLAKLRVFKGANDYTWEECIDNKTVVDAEFVAAKVAQLERQKQFYLSLLNA